MKKLTILLSAIAMLASQASAQQVVEDNFSRLKVHYSTPELRIKASDGIVSGHVNLSLDGYLNGGEVGSPALPILSSYIEVPFCNTIVVKVENAVYDTVLLDGQTVEPLQPSRSKSDRSEPVLVKNQKVYASDAFVGGPVASVDYVGIARDRNLALLRFAPVSVNPATGKAVICRSADVTVVYEGSDEQYTRDYYSRYNTPAYTSAETLNHLFSPKEISNATPIRYVIVTPQSLNCTSVRNFATWKRQQGMRVDIVEVSNGATATAILQPIKDMYTNATAADPAPAYVLLVGDHNQLRAFDSRLQSSWWSGPDNDHITDLYYVTWTDGDNIPDAYIGRFSATDSATVSRIVAKTRYYERYDFEDDSYLAKAAIIAGVDNGGTSDNSDNAWRYADPNMDYAVKEYVNPEHGFTTVHYFKNNTSHIPAGCTVEVEGSSKPNSSATTLRNYYSEGMGWINYSAHGDWNKWHQPEFNVDNVSSMNNTNKPSFMIGNCCLTNKFDKPTCFGEALLRKGDKSGAVAYIGGTNSTYWSEDFYWSVGIRSSIYNLMDATYSASQRGMYDHLFHTHGETLANQNFTAGGLMMAGNLQVQAASSTEDNYKQYYWEIYEIMGDPSLMPWLGQAADLPVTIALTMDVKFTTVPGAYVAIVNSSDNQVLSAGFTDASGVVYLDRPANIASTYFTITAQNYKPYIKNFSEAGVGISNPTDDNIAVYPNPAADKLYVQADGLRSVELLNTLGQPVLKTTGEVVDLQGIASGLYIVRVSTANGISLKKVVVK